MNTDVLDVGAVVAETYRIEGLSAAAGWVRCGRRNTCGCPASTSR